MVRAELKTYLQVLKSRGKTSPHKEVEIDGEQIRVGGEKISEMFAFRTPVKTKGNGVYSLEVLDILAIDLEADIEAYRIRDLEGWRISVGKETGTLSVDKTLISTLAEATKYVSKDFFRPPFCRVHLTNRDVMATDGYTGYLKRIQDTSLEGNFSPTAISVLKRCFKYGGWRISLGEGVYHIYNEHFSIYGLETDFSATPPLRATLERMDLNADIKVSIPYKQIKALGGERIDLVGGGEKMPLGVCEKTTEVVCEETLGILLDGKPLPLKATITPVDFSYKEGSDITVLMPNVDNGHFLSFSAPLLKRFPLDKEGNINLLLKKCSKKIMMVV